MRILAVSILFVATALVASEENCSDGPKMWCSTLKNAKTCNAMEHCIQAVWGAQKYPEDSDVPCHQCKEFVTEARDFLKKGKPGKSVRDMFQDNCKKSPYAWIVAECVSLSEGYEFEIERLVVSTLEPLSLCTAARFCNNKKIDEGIAETKSQQAPKIEESGPFVNLNDDTEIFYNECDVCQAKMGQLAIHFKAMTDVDVMDRLFMVCGEFGSYSSSCSALVMAHFDKMRTWIENRLKPVDLCQLTNKCMQPDSNKRGVLKNEDTCEVCTDTLNNWRSILVLNSTEEDFKELLLDVCTEVGFLVDQCRDVVDQYYVPLYDWLIHQFQPKVICKDIGFCSSTGDLEADVWPVLPVNDEEIAAPISSKVNLQPQIYDRGGLVKDGPLESDASWFDNIPDAIRHPLLPVNVVINPMSESTAQPLPENKLPSPIELAGSESCAICQTVLHEIENQLSDGQTQDEIKNIVENICDRLPTGIDQQCRGFVERYGSFAIELLVQKIDPASVCPKLNLCPEGIEIEIFSLDGGEFPKIVSYDLEANLAPQQETVTCVICEYAVGTLQQILGENATQDEVREALDSLCDRLPDKVVGECRLFVDAYSAEVIDAVLLNLTPQQTCRYLMLCTPPKPAIMDQKTDLTVEDLVASTKESTELERALATPGCILCEFIMRQLDEMLKNNATEENIEANLKMVCSVLPKTIRTDCDNFVAQYFKAIIDTLENVPPHEACSVIALCASRPTHGKENFRIQKETMRCLICKDLMGFLEEIISDDRIDHAIGDDLEKLCKYLPKGVGKKYKGQCRDIMEHYGPYVVSLIATLKKPQELCSYIDMCDAIPGMAQIDPNVENCELGPKYYCAKMSRAKACGKVSFCNENILTLKKTKKSSVKKLKH